MFWDDTRMGNYQQQFDKIEFLVFVWRIEMYFPGCRDKAN